MKPEIPIYWLRRDLRLHDNPALYKALQHGNVLCIFIFDTHIIEELPINDARISLIYDQLQHIHQELQSYNSGLSIYHGTPEQVFMQLFEEYTITGIFANEDYEPYGISRDATIAALAQQNQTELHLYQDHVIFHPSHILTDAGKPYHVFTPFAKKWKSLFQAENLPYYPSEKKLEGLLQITIDFPSLKQFGFEYQSYSIPNLQLDAGFQKSYKTQRDYPAQDYTTHSSVYLRFGMVSVREMISQIHEESLLNELIWREFFMMIVFHYPQVVTENFKAQYNTIQWENNLHDFERWKTGTTGYPLVDAGMRELNTTGLMHNRIRMITAGFLCKHLLIDWRWGEAYFAEKLLDYELSSNNGNWQWAAGTGCDAAPYFRIFNPTTQLQKFDPDVKYLQKWVPEWQELNYPTPMVEHKWARERALHRYKIGMSQT